MTCNEMNDSRLVKLLSRLGTTRMLVCNFDNGSDKSTIIRFTNASETKEVIIFASNAAEALTKLCDQVGWE